MFPSYFTSLTLSPHSCHLLRICRPVKWPLLWCLQVSEECSVPSGSSVLLACLWLLSLFMLCKEAGAKQHIYICQVLLMLLMLQSHSDATLHQCCSLCGPAFKNTHSPIPSLCSPSVALGFVLCVSSFPPQNIQIQIRNTDDVTIF